MYVFEIFLSAILLTKAAPSPVFNPRLPTRRVLAAFPWLLLAYAFFSPNNFVRSTPKMYTATRNEKAHKRHTHMTCVMYILITRYRAKTWACVCDTAGSAASRAGLPRRRWCTRYSYSVVVYCALLALSRRRAFTGRVRPGLLSAQGPAANATRVLCHARNAVSCTRTHTYRMAQDNVLYLRARPTTRPFSQAGTTRNSIKITCLFRARQRQ